MLCWRFVRFVGSCSNTLWVTWGPVQDSTADVLGTFIHPEEKDKSGSMSSRFPSVWASKAEAVFSWEGKESSATWARGEGAPQTGKLRRKQRWEVNPSPRQSPTQPERGMWVCTILPTFPACVWMECHSWLRRQSQQTANWGTMLLMRTVISASSSLSGNSCAAPQLLPINYRSNVKAHPDIPKDTC